MCRYVCEVSQAMNEEVKQTIELKKKRNLMVKLNYIEYREYYFWFFYCFKSRQKKKKKHIHIVPSVC